jgi:DNA-binding transcriptional LysR family regulator
MEMMQLRMLVALAEEGNLQKAAERVYRTAPAVSIAITKLEEEIGTPLFDRVQGHDFRLTAAGDVLVGYAKRLLSLRDEAAAAVEEVKSLKRGHLRIGANQSIGEYLLPQLTEKFLERYPDVKLKVVIGYSDSVLSALKHRELDLALVASVPHDDDLHGQLLLRDRLVAIMNPGHPWASRDLISIRELTTASLIVLGTRSELRERIAETFRRSRIPLNVRIETETLQSIKQMAARNMGVGIVPRICVQKEEASGALIAKPIDEFREERSLWIVSRRQSREPSPVCQAFLTLIKSEVKKPARGINHTSGKS